MVWSRKSVKPRPRKAASHRHPASEPRRQRFRPRIESLEARDCPSVSFLVPPPQLSSSATLTSNVNPSVFGQAVTFSTTVTGASGTPTGTVTFDDGATSLGAATLSGGSASLAVSTLGVNTHTITVIYSGDTNFAPCTSSPLSETVNQDGSTTVLSSSANPAIVNRSVTFTATVSAAPPGAGTPTGSVTFIENGTTTLGAGTLSSSDQASLTTSFAALGAYTITAVYGGDGNFTGSTSTGLTESVDKSVTVSLGSSANPASFGQSITFTAVITTSPAGGYSGTITFMDGSTTLGTGAVNSSGDATLVTSTLAVGTHSITAVYGGNGTLAPATSAVLSETVKADATTTALTSSVNPVNQGNAVIFTATVTASAPGSGTPAGTVTFKDGAATLGTGILNSSRQATFTTSTLAAGTQSITAVYDGNVDFAASTSSTLSETVIGNPTTTTVASLLNPSTFGQSVTCTATVTGSLGTPTGTVTFEDGGASIGAGTLNGSGVASYVTTGLAARVHSITAVYGGNSTYGKSTSSVLNQTVLVDSSSTTVTSSINPSSPKQTVTFTATVSAVAPGAGMPTGTVTFLNGTTTLGSGTLFSADKVTFTTSTLSTGTDVITAVYKGDANFTTSSGSLSQTVTVGTTTTTTLSTSINPTVFGQSVTFTAAVTGSSGSPTGTVTFEEGSTTLGTGLLSSGHASFTTTALPVGTDPITAVYGGNANFAGSTSAALSQTVNRASTSVTIVSSVNPTVFGQPATFTVTVIASSPGNGTPTGSVTFKDGSATLGTVTLSGKSASLTTTALPVGTQSITAVYNSDANFNGSTSSNLAQTVEQASTTTIVISRADPSVVSQPVTLSMTVLAAAPGSGVPTGTVTLKFSIRGSVGTATLVNGTATITTSTLFEGTSLLIAHYNGDANFSASNSATLTQTVNPDSTTTNLVSSLNPSNSGVSVTFTATVTANAPGTGTPTGSVTFKDGTATLGSAALNASGVATFTTSTLAVGSHSITAVYNATTNYSTSTSPLLTQTVTAAPGALLVTAPLVTTGSANSFRTMVNITPTDPSPASAHPAALISAASTSDAAWAGMAHEESGDDLGLLADGYEPTVADSRLGSLDRVFTELGQDTDDRRDLTGSHGRRR